MSDNYNYRYSGLGDRVQQTVNGVTTTYVLDLAAHLTEVLADGTSTFLNGLGRIGEKRTGEWLYHMPDALGSVRQLVDSAGAISFSQSYEPFGDVLVSYGQEGSQFGYTGQLVDGNGLVYLRARYYNTGFGRFISKDTWGGNYFQPQTLNPWNYALANPVIFQDPSGNWCIAGFSIGPGRGCTEEQQNNWVNFYNHQAAIWYQLGQFGGDAQAYVTGFLYEYVDIVAIVPTVSITAVLLDAIIGCDFRSKFDEMHNDDRFIAGRYAARAFLFIQAAGEIGSGLGGVGAGVSISLTGVGAAVGVPAISLSTALVGHGAAVMAVLAIKGWADPLPAFFHSSGGSGSTGSTPKNPTNRDTASKNPSNWREAEEILEKDLGVPKNEEIFLSSEYGLEARRYRKPDFVGDDFIADAKWYSRASVSDSAQLRDYVKISISEGKPLWLYVRKNTTITSTAELSVLNTGGGIVRYFP